MDLEAHREKKLSELFVKEYRRLFPRFETEEDKAIFVYYKCYRANVRAKVHALAAERESNPMEYRRNLSAVKKYLHLMERYMANF